MNNGRKNGYGVLSVIVSLFSSLVAAFFAFIATQDAVITAAVILVTAIAVSTGFLINAVEKLHFK
ncbi:MAG: hypothetical protein Q4A15_00300 [Prevotellaceae bacterium]|nr:hypothetical protein [Prevotellaceae bacterium]